MGEKKSANKKQEEDRAEKIRSLQEMIATAERTITSAKAMLSQVQIEEKASGNGADFGSVDDSDFDGDGQIIHGTFDGQIMIGEDGKQYPVPANYASKSKLVEGDMLKLTITGEGNFVYKQIGPAERKYLIGIANQDERGNFFVKTEDRSYKVLLAAATYFKIEAGDEVTVIVPREGEVTWGAIENIVRKASDVLSSPDINLQSEPMQPKLTEESANGKPTAIEKLEKEIEDERKSAKKKDDILDEWTPDIDQMKKEAKQPAGAEEDVS